MKAHLVARYIRFAIPFAGALSLAVGTGWLKGF